MKQNRLLLIQWVVIVSGCFTAFSGVTLAQEAVERIWETSAERKRIEPLTVDQVEILAGGRSLENDYLRYLKRYNQYENFVDYEYQISIQRAQKGRRLKTVAGALMATSVIPFTLGGVFLYRNGNHQQGESDDPDDSYEEHDSFANVAVLFGGGLLVAGTAMLISGFVIFVNGNAKEEAWTKIATKIKPYADYYAPETTKWLKITGVGIVPSSRGLMLGASASF